MKLYSRLLILTKNTKQSKNNFKAPKKSKIVVFPGRILPYMGHSIVTDVTFSHALQPDSLCQSVDKKVNSNLYYSTPDRVDYCDCMIETFHLESISLIFMIILVSVTDVTQKGHHFSFAMFNFGFVGKYKSKKYKFTMSCSLSLNLVSLVVNLNYISLFTCSQAIIDRYGRYTVSLRTLHPLHYTRNNT